MIVYFDSSALVKLVIDEEDSDIVAALWDGADQVLSSRVAYAEVRAGLAAAHRAGRLTAAQLADAKRAWTTFWEALRVIEVSAQLDTPAGDLAEQYRLSGFDALHLASALLISSDHALVATWDHRLLVAASATGLRTVPPVP